MEFLKFNEIKALRRVEILLVDSNFEHHQDPNSSLLQDNPKTR